MAFCGCAATRFTVDAVRDSRIPARGESYLLTCSGSGWSHEQKHPEQIVSCLKAALSSKGLYGAPRGVSADMAIDVTFGMDPPRRQAVSKVDYLHPPCLPTNCIVLEDPRSVANPLIRNFAGYIVTISEIVVCRKFMHISAREMVAGTAMHLPRELWSVDVMNEDASDTLDAYLPLMIAAAMDSMAPLVTTHKTIDLAREDRRVVFVTKKI